MDGRSKKSLFSRAKGAVSVSRNRYEGHKHHLGSYQCPVKSNKMARQPGKLIKTQVHKFSWAQRVSLGFEQIIGSEAFKKLPWTCKGLDPAPSAVSKFLKNKSPAQIQLL